jgi:hypothetical protein
MQTLITPRITEIPQLKKIWCECFPDDADGYCDFFFEHYFKPEICLAVYNGKELESAIYMFDAFYKVEGKKQKFRYLYAGGTLKKYRGKNNLKYMLDGCLTSAREHGCAGTVVVADDDIVYLYDRWGYRRMAELHTYSVEAVPSHDTILWQICPFEKFSSLRTQYLDSIGNSFYWTDSSGKYMYDDIFTKGYVLIGEYEGREYYVVCTKEPDRYIIRETSFPLEQADVLIGSIAGFCNYSGTFTVYSHSERFVSAGEYQTEDIYYGHVRISTDCTAIDTDCLGEAYLNLIAD